LFINFIELKFALFWLLITNVGSILQTEATISGTFFKRHEKPRRKDLSSAVIRDEVFLPGEEFAPTERDDLLKDSFGERGLVKTAAQVEMQASQQPESQPLVTCHPS
jgi:hypothetical protein